MEYLRPAPPVAVVVARLVDRGHRTVVVDGRGVLDKSSALAAVAAAAAFPDWVGHNLDALADALGDLSWLDGDGPVAVVWTHADRLGLLDDRTRTGLLGVLADVENDDGPVTDVVLLDAVPTT